jgi:hypothetical protein
VPYGWAFRCPACNEEHVLKGWTFNGNADRPTFSPSVLVSYNGADADAANGAGLPSRCHSYVREGRIQFLPDCSHALKGQTVDLPEYPSP